MSELDTSLKEALIKEVKEESGYVVVPKRVLALLDYRKHHESLSPYGIYKIFTECELIEGHFKENIETSETGFFTLENLPPLSLNRVTLDQIQMCFNVRGKPCHEAIFD